MSSSLEKASIQDLVSALENAGRAPALELIRVAMTRRRELTPYLLDLLATLPAETWEEDDPRWYTQIHAGHLLIFFREPQAIPIFMRLLRQPKSDNLVEWFGVALASYGLGILGDIAELLNDPDAPEYSRIVATDTLEQIAAEFPTERGRVIEVLKHALPPLNKNGLLDIPKPRPHKPNVVWSFVASSLAVLTDFTSRPQIEALYYDKWMDESVMGDLIEYRERLLHPKVLRSNAFNIIETYEALLEEETKPAWDSSSISELQRQLHELNSNKTTEPEQEETGDTLLHTEDEQALTEDAPKIATPRPAAARRLTTTAPPVQETIRRTMPKVGRNDPCPCGSGRKYKHCHGKS